MKVYKWGICRTQTCYSIWLRWNIFRYKKWNNHASNYIFDVIFNYNMIENDVSQICATKYIANVTHDWSNDAINLCKQLIILWFIFRLSLQYCYFKTNNRLNIYLISFCVIHMIVQTIQWKITVKFSCKRRHLKWYERISLLSTMYLSNQSQTVLFYLFLVWQNNLC